MPGWSTRTTPHENFEHEHQGEARDHDHDMPVKEAQAKKAARAGEK